MNKLFLLMLMMVFPMVASSQGYVNNFKWEENEGTYNGFPLVTVAVGDKHKLQYSYTTNTMGTDIFDVNSGNWVFYENNTVVNAPTVFSMNAQGVVTGVKEGLGALKPTGLILKASGTDRLYIKVVSSYEEQEPNNDFNSANELKGAPTTFGLYNLSDIDYFKVKANAGDKITFKIKGDNSNNKFFGFKWSKFSSTYQSLGSGSLAIDESTGERDIEISSAFTSNYGTGYYYLEIYYDQSRSQYFTYDKLTVQAFLNDKPVSYEETEPDPEPVYDVKFSYDDSNMTATVIADDNKYTGNIVIPESVIHNGNTYKVISIGKSAFSGCSGLTSVTIPNSVTTIGWYAFKGCSGLTSVTIPNGVTSLDGTFSGCSGLTSVTIPNSVTSINETFNNCINLTSITIPNSVTSIEGWAFCGCSGLTSVTIPNSVTTIGWYAFKGCSGLTSVTIGNGVTVIGIQAFQNCSVLTSVTIPNSVAGIGNQAFSGCSGLTSVTIPNSVNSIGGGAFSGCTSLSSINIPTSLTTIEYDLFNGCSNLTSITIPNGVTSIGDDAFSGCSSLNTIEIPENVSVIGTSAFEGCVNLSTIVIGSGVKTIYTGAFANCTNLKEVYCYAEAVPAIVQMHYDNHNHVFDNSPISDAKLYVPQTSIANYKTKWPWSLFKQVLSLGGEFSYPEFIYEIGVDGGWIKSHPLRRKGDTGIYIGYYYLMGEFKFREHESDWDGTQWGIGSEEGKITQGESAQNINAKEGFYQIEVNLDEMTYRLTQIMTIGIAGSHNGWASNSEMVYDNGNGVWLSGLLTLSEAETEFKFCANNDWAINWGGSFDNLTRDAGNLKLTKGLYNLELSLSYEGNNKLRVDLLHLITFYVDGKQYFSFALKPGDKIPAVHAPQKEGYTFSGWNGLPEVMPDHDVTVTGSFIINKYKLIYMVDGAVYRTVSYEYCSTITPEAEPTKEGYTFSGWSTIPETMPAKDVTVTGSFTINKYKLIYMVDGTEYKFYNLEYGAKITPEAEPTKEGYSFSGWSSIPETMPAKDVVVTGSFSKGAYKLTYMVDGQVYKTVSYDYGATITPEAAPTKEGYTFSGWSDIPLTMPAKDVTVTGTFTINKYKLVYLVDGEEYKSYDIEYGATITPEAWPTKEGYTFLGWSEIPETMPAHDVVVTGTFIQNEQTTEFTVDDVTYDITGEGTVTIVGSDQKGDVEIQSTVEINGQTFYVTAIGDYAFKDNQNMTSLTIPEGVTAIGSYAFEGCINLTNINIGKDVQKIGSMAFANIGSTAAARTRGESPLVVNCYAVNVPDAEYDAFLYTPIENGTLLVNDNLVDEYKMTAPWNYFGKIMGFEEAVGINAISVDSANARIYDMQGNRLDNPQKGVNIIRYKDGRTQKVVIRF